MATLLFFLTFSVVSVITFLSWTLLWTHNYSSPETKQSRT